MIGFENIGSLRVICGPMASGKSHELIRVILSYQVAGKKVVCFKPLIDVRDDSVCSRSGLSAEVDVHNVNDSEDIMSFFHDLNESADLVAIDEAQFFDYKIVEVVKELSMKMDCVVSGLDKDYLGNPFGPMPDLLAIADDVTKLKAVCIRCKKRYATCTYRIVPIDNIIAVGGDDKYEARCRACWEGSG